MRLFNTVGSTRTDRGTKDSLGANEGREEDGEVELHSGLWCITVGIRRQSGSPKMKSIWGVTKLYTLVPVVQIFSR